ncbi:MAG: hypothetical protein L0216_10105 [Planctomycetales bacterium]|nr:hypothetical protein [Planctomycetales bacterium]
MKRALALLSLALLAIAPPALAQDKKYDLGHKDKWQAGDVVTTTEDSTQTQKVSVTDGMGNPIQSQNEKVKSRVVRVTKCLEANAEGKVTKCHVYFKEWSWEQGGEADGCLKGGLYEVTGLGAERVWKRVGGGGEPSNQAQTWLDKNLGAQSGDEEAKEAALRPKAPIAVGETWKPDIEPLLQDPEMAAIPMDKSKATATGKLEAVEKVGANTVGRIRFDISIPISGFPGMPEGMEIKWTKAAVLKLSGTGTVGIEGRLVPDEGEFEFSLAGEADIQGMRMVLDIKAEETTEEALGGEIPAGISATPGGSEGKKK